MEKKTKISEMPLFSPRGDKVKYLLYFLFIFCFEPKLFVKIPWLNLLYVMGALVSFACMARIYLGSRKRPSLLLIALVVYRMSFAVQTLMRGGDVLMWGYLSLVLMTMCMAIEYYIRDSARELLGVIITVLLVLLTVNFLLALVRPDGVVEGIHFIGIRTRLTDVIMPLLVLCLIRDYLNLRRISLCTAYAILLSLLTVLQQSIVTAILGLVILAVGTLVLTLVRKKWIDKCVNVFTITAVGLAVNYLIAFFQITLRMEQFLGKVLNKSGTLTGRTDLWDSAIALIREKLLFGYGMADNGNFVPATDFLDWEPFWQAHNQWLQILYDGGLVALISFVILILVTHRGLNSRCDRHLRGFMLAGLFSMLIMMTVEIFSYTPYFFLFIFIGYHIGELKRADGRTVDPFEAVLVLEIKRAWSFGASPVWQRLLCRLFPQKGRYRKKHAAILDALEEKLADTINTCKKMPVGRARIGRELPVFFFVPEGLTQAPESARACLASLKANCGSHEVIVLCRDNLSDYVQLPAFVFEKLEAEKMSGAQFSELLAVSLLARHGGIFCDASLHLSSPLPSKMYQYAFYSIRHVEGDKQYLSERRWTTAFMASAPGGYVPRVIEKLLLAYWERYNVTVDEFLTDYCIKLAYECIPTCRVQMDAVPVNKDDIRYQWECCDDATARKHSLGIPAITHMLKYNR